MPEMPKNKVGIVSCSGEDIAEGTVTRLAALKVLEQLRRGETVTICLPLFLAGGEGDRAFARFYPTIAVDGCALCCAARGREMYSGQPAVSLVVSEFVQEGGLQQPEGLRRLNSAGIAAVHLLAVELAIQVDNLLVRQWNRRTGDFDLPVLVNETPATAPEGTIQATCACGSGIPVQKVMINGQCVTLVALPVMLQQFKETGKAPDLATINELLEQVKSPSPPPDPRDRDPEIRCALSS